LIAISHVLGALVINAWLATFPSGLPAVYSDPFLWEDLVVRATVVDVTRETIAAEDWYPVESLRPGTQPVEFVRISITTAEFLRGRDTAVLWARLWEDPDGARSGQIETDQRVRPGMEIVAAASYIRNKNMWFARALMIRSGSTFARVYGDMPDSMTMEEISKRVEMVSVPTMTRESDLVFRGRVTSGELVGEYGNEHYRFVITPEKVLKGKAAEPVVLEADRAFSSDEADWRLLINDLDLASSYYFFLQQHGDIYTPTAGRRSIFDSSGEWLNQGMSEYSHQSLEGMVRRHADN
jgi:hypothetical protein